MLDGDQADQTADDDVAEDANPACIALVPLVQTAQWTRSRPRPGPTRFSSPN